MTEISVSAGDDFGARVRVARNRRGLSREAAAALCGRSEEWLRQIERGARGTTLKMLVRLAEVLHVENLADLLGSDTPTTLFTRPEHEALGAVRRALLAPGGTPKPPSLPHLRERVNRAWKTRAASSRDRTALATLLPGLLIDGQSAVAGARSESARRNASAVLAEIYHLSQLYLCYQDAPELLWVAVDRANNAAREAADPAMLGRAAWFSSYLYRDFGHIEQAHQVIDDALVALESADPTPQVARQRTTVYLASAWTYARQGKPAQAWRAWDSAVENDREAAPVADEKLLFGAHIDDVALSLDIDLGRIASASRRAERINLDAVLSVPRRARLTIEAARGQMLKREYAGGVHLLRRACKTSPEATVFSAYTRSMMHELRNNSGPLLRRDVAELEELLTMSA